MELTGDVQFLRKQNVEKEKRITLLGNRVGDLEQYSWMNDLINSSMKTRHQFYAGVAVASEGTTAGRGVNAPKEQQVVGFLDSKSISVDNSDIEACHTLPNKKSATPAIIIHFTNRKKNSPGSCFSAMDQCEDREEGVPPSESSLCGEHDSQTRAQRMQQQRADSPEPSCVSMKSDRSMGRLIEFKDGQPADG
eukprot:superscaffoldBa00009004_g23791